MLNLKEEVTFAINCLVEGLEDKKTVVNRIVDYVDKNYISTGDLKGALERMGKDEKGDK